MTFEKLLLDEGIQLSVPRNDRINHLANCSQRGSKDRRWKLRHERSKKTQAVPNLRQGSAVVKIDCDGCGNWWRDIHTVADIEAVLEDL